MKDHATILQKFEQAVFEGKATWWQMDLPSGDVIFGYPESNFKHYRDFTNLLHKQDYDKTMNAMRDHMAGKKKFYETVYRIRHKDGEYIKFYDCGQIVKKEGNNITVVGFVWKVQDDENIEAEMKEFKDMIAHGDPSMIDLVKKIR